MARRNMKRYPVDSSVEDAINYAYDTIEELRDEISDGVENQRDHAGIAATQRFQTMEESVEKLTEVVDNRPDWCSSIDTDLSNEITCSYTIDATKRPSRGSRRDNATSALSAAADALITWADELESLRDSLPENQSDEEHIKALGGRDDDTVEDQITEARELAETLEEHQSTADDAEFPGMRG